MKRKHMEFANLWLPLIGGLLLGGFALALWYGGNKITAIWAGFAGAVCLLLLAALQFQEAVLEGEKVVPANPTGFDKRAWVGVHSVVPNPPLPKVGDKFETTISFVNSGETPAVNVVGRFVAEGVTAEGKPNFDYADTEKFSVGYMPPGAKHYATVRPVRSKSTGEERTFTKELLEAVTSGAMRLYVHGRVDYDDVTGQPHWLTYCYFLEVPFSGRFVVCSDHNNSDANPE